MASTMADVLLLIFVVVSILLLFTAFDSVFAIPYFRPSRQEGRDLCVAIEDLVLPMGSFPSRLLHPWSPTPRPYNSSTMPPTSNSGSKQEAVPAPDESTPVHDRTNPIAILSFTPLMTIDIEPRVAATLSFTPLTTIDIEPKVAATSPAVNKVLAEFHAFENEIRGLMDPEGIHSPQSKRTIDLVTDEINKHAEVVEDLRHDWEVLYEDLLRQNDGEKEASRHLRIQIEGNIETLKVAEQAADKAEQTAEAGVQKRIDVMRTWFEQESKKAEDKIKQERNSFILSKRKIENGLAEARSQVTLLKEQQKTATKENTSTIRNLKESLRQKSLAVTTSEELAASADRSLQVFIDEKRKKESLEITTLRKQLRESNEMAKSLGPWKTKAENEKRNSQRLSDRLTDTENTLREEKKHAVNDLELQIRSLKRDMATDEFTINRQQDEISELESGKELQDLKSQLGKAEKQLKNAKLENETLKSTLRACDAKTKQDAEISYKERESHHEESKRIAVENAVQQASIEAEMDAAMKATEKEQEYKQRTRIAIENALKKARVDTEKKAAAEAEKKVAAEAEKKVAAEAENVALKAEKKAAREAEMDTAPDAEMGAAEMGAAEKEQRHQQDMAEAVQNAVVKAAEDAKKQEQQHQMEMAEAVQNAVMKAVEDAKTNHEKEKKEIVAANEAAEVARQTQEAPDKVTQTKSSDVADRQTSGPPVELTLAATEANEATILLEEIVKNGVAMDTIEHAALRRLTEIRNVLHNVKAALQIPHAVTETRHYTDMIRGFKLEESVLEHLDNGTMKSLVRLGRTANGRLKKVSEILETSGVQKDAILQALIGPKRDVKPMRGLKRPTQSKNLR